MSIIVISSNSIGIKDFRIPLLKEFIRLNKKVIVLGPKDEYSEELKNKILRPLRIPYKFISINNTSFNILYDVRTIFQIIKYFIIYKPDIVINYTMKPIIYGTLAALLTGRRNVYSFATGLGYLFTEESIKIKKLRFIFVFIYRLVFLLNKKVFFQNIDDIKLFDNQLKKINLVLIPGSGVDMEKYKFSPLEKTIKFQSFLFIGRILKHKGIEEFLHAAKFLKEKYENVSFSVVGDFTHNPSQLKPDEFNQWVVSRVINYYGYQDDVRDIIKDSTVFVLPSYREGLSHSILEAMSMGRPIITTNVPGCRDVIVDGESGFIVKKGSVEDLINSMEKFIHNPKLASDMGLNAHQRVMKNYEISLINRLTLSALEMFESTP